MKVVNAALEWQAVTVEINKNLVAACPLEGLVRSDLACRQESRVEFRVDVVNCTQRKWETYREGGFMEPCIVGSRLKRLNSPRVPMVEHS